MPRVLNKRIHDIPADAVYVGRPSKWGNPHYMREEAHRDAVCDAYEASLTRWLAASPGRLEQLKQELRGKDLVCWCAPKRCHADLLLHLANK